MELYSVYVPTNHIYVGDIFLLGKEDIIHTNLSVREGLGESFLPNPAAFLESGMLCWMHSICWCWVYRALIECCAAAAEIVVSVGMALPRSLSAYIKT